MQNEVRILIARAMAILLLLTAGGRADEGAAEIDFNRDIRPILSDKCYRCHGPDPGQRQTDLRLDVQESTSAELDSGVRAIVPGNLASSELYRRITAAGADERMPPADSGKSLTPREIALLRGWIEAGAPWGNHWAFVAPGPTSLPAVRDRAWPRNGIDHFTLAVMEREGLRPAPEADKVTLARRVTLTLTGLPATPAEIDAFLADTSRDAYQKLVDRLIESPRYGEHMARYWLDAARYGDTHGLHLDNERSVWLYRDWVIDALNANMPFDRFTIEQLAGDLLPETTTQQKIASGFHRCNVTTSEGGAIDEEFRVRYAIDRVETTSAVWMGLTAGCAVCHDHKFDPISQKEFYQLFAYFYSLTEKPMDGNALLPPPAIKAPTRLQRLKLELLEAELAGVERQLAEAGDLAGEDADAGSQPLRARRRELRRELRQLRGTFPSTLVMQDRSQLREAHVLVRGQYDRPGEKVLPGVPAVLPALSPDAPANRLALARWLVDPAHPLTARVTVNRLWQRHFGTGIVKSSEDFGSQGEWPSHPRLLDWLATEFVRGGWDMKGMHRLMVTSATYRQASRVTPEAMQRDPENRLLARGPRFRMDAEMIRDTALAASGLLVEHLGGESVKPYQPEGLWEAVAYPTSTTAKFKQDHGEALYRRSMYTFWKRTAPPPTMQILDAPSREYCTVTRPRTNTPSAALALMNDVQFVEAARNLAQRVLREAGPSTDDRIRHAFRLATCRFPTDSEAAVLRRLYLDSRQAYRDNVDLAVKLLGVGESPRDQDEEAAELAAWTMVANTILNLDETISQG